MPNANPAGIVTSDALRQTVINILKMDGLAQVNFELGGLVVTGVRYGVVRQNLISGNITCSIDKNLPVQAAGAMPGTTVLAKYIPSPFNKDKLPPNQIICPSQDYGSSDETEICHIVHEATHAMFDIFMKGQDFKAIYNEAAAVVASVLFARRAHLIPKGFMAGYYVAAYRIADKIIAADSLANGQTYNIVDQDCEDLFARVADNWGLTWKTEDAADGV